MLILKQNLPSHFKLEKKKNSESTIAEIVFWNENSLPWEWLCKD